MKIECILDFWFGTNPDDAVVAKEQAELWWLKNRDTDDKMRRRFEESVRAAAAGELCHWQANPRGRLALILLTDQFPRNIYRDSPKAFAYDPKALAWCLDGIRQSLDLKVRPIERTFFYLPLEHAESIEHQEQSVKHFGQLVSVVSAEQKQTFDEYLDLAIRHRDIIARFGRFPHRNKILGRESRLEELAFLNEPGSSF